MRDEPRTLADEREPMTDAVPEQRSHGAPDDATDRATEGAPDNGAAGPDGEDRAVGVAPAPDGAEVPGARVWDPHAQDEEAQDPQGWDAHAPRPEVQSDEPRPADAEPARDNGL